MRVKLAQAGEDGWVLAHPLSLHLPSPVKFQCTLQLSGHWGRYTNPVSSLVKICTLWRKSPSAPPQPPAVGGGGSVERGIIMPLGEEWRGFGSFWGQVVRKYLERDLQTFTGIVTFRFSFRFWLIFAFIFFAVWSVSLDCEQSEKNIFFRFKARTKIPTFSLVFALSEYERRTLV